MNFGWSGQTSTNEWWWQTTTDSSQSEQRPQQRITLRLWVILGSSVMGNWLITTATFPQPATVISINHSDLINIVWSIIVHCILYFEFLITVNLYRVLPMIFSPLNTGINLLHWSLGAGTLLLLKCCGFYCCSAEGGKRWLAADHKYNHCRGELLAARPQWSFPFSSHGDDYIAVLVSIGAHIIIQCIHVQYLIDKTHSGPLTVFTRPLFVHTSFDSIKRWLRWAFPGNT